MTARERWARRQLHFVGVGGCGMSGLALVSHALGARVTGSDQAETPFLERLRDAGIGVTIGHSASVVPTGAEVVYSSAIPYDNPERTWAREQRLPEVARGQLLAEVTRMRSCIAVAGTHGKTTTAAMIVHAMRGTGEAVDYVVGGDLLATGCNAEWDDRGWLVAETDESDRSLLELAPEIAVLTNVDYEHVETFRSIEDVEAVFRAFLRRSKRSVVLDRPETMRLRQGPGSAFDAQMPQVTATGSTFGWRGHTVRVGVPGAHNALNAAAALEACLLAGADPARLVVSLADFPGVARRFQSIGCTASGAEVYDDYAHHPSEVAATLTAARALAPDRLVAVLRPWGPARTQALARKYGQALAEADLVMVLDIAHVGVPNKARQGVTAGLVVAAAQEVSPGRPVKWVSGPLEAERGLRDEVGPGTICVTLGCGDVAQQLIHTRRPEPRPVGSSVA